MILLLGTNAYTIAATSNVNVLEGTKTIAYTITRAGDLTIGSTSYFRTNGGTAQTDGTDYTVINSQQLTWGVGEFVKVVTVTLTDDNITEGNETIIGQSSNDSAFTTGLKTITLTVLDDDLYTATAGDADTLTTGTVNGN